MGDIHLDQINIVVSDMEASAAFYARVGLQIGDGGPQWNPHHRDAPTGGADVDLDSSAFAAVWNQGWPGGGGIVLSFRLPTRDAVDEVYGRLRADGHPGQQEPYDAFWGARFAVVADPDGNAVGLMSPADPAFRSPGPPPPRPA